jgi:acetyl-CoA carboxylase biotin carboxyl carrier protein
MSIDIAQLHQIALHQIQRNVDTVEFTHNNARVRMRFNGQTTQSTHSPASIADTASSLTTHTPRVQDDHIKTVKSDKLGILRLSHPTSASEVVREGDTVVSGQPIVYLQVGVSLTAITSPYNGVLQQVLVKEGQCIDYGLPLFDIAIVNG